MNILNNIVGAGLYSMPWTLMMATVLSGSLVTVWICVLNMISFVLLADSCERTGTFSYLELGRGAFGEGFGKFSQIVCVCYTFGSLVSYVVLAGDCLVGDKTGLLVLLFGDSSFLGGGSVGARVAAVYGLGFAFFFPMAMPRTIDALRYASYLAFVGTMYGAAVVVYTCVARPEDAYADDLGKDDDGFPGPPSWAGFPIGIWQAVPIVNVAFTAHYNAPRFYYELRDRSPRRFASVVVVTMVGALAIYLGVAWAGYLAFRGATLGDVLEDFAANYPLAIGVRGSLLVILLAVFPKVSHNNRDGWARLVWGQSSDDLDLKTYTALTLAICAVVFTLGAVCTQVEVVLAYKGGIFGSLMVYIIPPLVNTAVHMDADDRRTDVDDMHLQLISDDDQDHSKKRHQLGRVAKEMLSNPAYRVNAVLLVWGACSGTLAVAITIMKQSGVL